MHPPTASLLPAVLEAARSRVPVASPLPAKRRPGYPAQARSGDLAAADRIWQRTGVLAHIGVGPGESYMLIDKRHPHAQHEVMVMSAGPEVRPGLHGHSAAFSAALGAMAACFAGYCRALDLYPVMSWSYDPDTTDRESIQGEKRFHAHLVGRSRAELRLVEALALPAGAYPPTQRRRAVDEASVLGSVLAADCLDTAQLNVLEPVAALSTPQSTAGLQFRVPGGWDTLLGQEVFSDLRAIHSTLQAIYDAVAAACLTGTSGRWMRPVLHAARASQVALPLSPDGRTALCHYLAALQPALLAAVEAAAPAADPASRRRATHVYPLAGLAYSVAVSEHAGSLFAYVRPNVFSDLGGAGMSVINGIITKIRKGSGVYDEDELAGRARFQRGYLAALRLDSSVGEQALFPMMTRAS